MRRPAFFVTAALAAAALLLCGQVGSAANQTMYVLSDLGVGQAYGINNSGVIVGTDDSAIDDYTDGISTDQPIMPPIGAYPGYVCSGNAVAWTVGATVTKSTLCIGGTAFGINASGQVVGQMNATANGVTGVNAFLYSGGTVNNLGTINPLDPSSNHTFASSVATAISNNGVVVGCSYASYDPNAGDNYHAFSYANGTMTDLGCWVPFDSPQCSSISAAYAVNPTGTVAYGASLLPDDQNLYSTSFSGGNVNDLGLGIGSTIYGANSSGSLVGITGTSSSGATNHAVLYQNGTATDLGDLATKQNFGSNNDSQANAINSSGEIVGTSVVGAWDDNPPYGDTYHAVVAIPDNSGNYTTQTIQYSDGGSHTTPLFDLNTMISPAAQASITLAEATAVNDSGDIVGYGSESDGSTHAFLLTPATPGDANLDGRVDINDLTVVLSHLNQTGCVWTQGEFTGDGTVDINDLTIVLAHYGDSLGSSAAVAAVPEPACLTLFGVAAASLLLFAWRKRRAS